MKIFLGILLLIWSHKSAYSQQFGPALKELFWLEGTWICDSKPEWHEEWIKTGDGLEGRGFHLKQGKEYVIENLQIRLRNGRPVYIALPKGAGREVIFAIEKHGNRFVCTNTANEWPQVIVYERLKSRQMKVSLGDLHSGGKKDKIYFFTKKKGRSWNFY